MIRVRVRKVWYREATIRRHRGERLSDRMELRKRKEKLDDNPRSRDRTRDLVRWYVRLGDLASAERLARHWLKKDRLDAGALVELAGIAALQGNADRSRELLASAVDVDPRSVAAHTRLVSLYRAANNLQMMCAHALTRAVVAPEDWKHQASAVQCHGDADRFFARLKPRKRRLAEKAAKKVSRKRTLWDRLLVSATWDAPQDVDIVVVTPRGRVISWMGGARRTRSEGATALRSEALASSLEERGRYQVYLVPRAGGAKAAVQGRVRIRSYGRQRTYPFATVGKATAVAEFTIRSKWRYERF
jgi:hypothetical protein